MNHLLAIKNNYHTIHDYFIPLMLSTEKFSIRERIIDEINPIIWMVWHILRTEDMYLNTVVYADLQVFQEDTWMEKLNITTRNTGTGMTRKDVDQLSKIVDKQALLDYNQAVKERSLLLVDRSVELGDEVMDTVEHIETRLKEADVFPEGVGQERARAYAKFPLSSGITGIVMHGFMHIGQYLILAKPL